MSSLPAPLSWARAGAAINTPPSKIAAKIFMSPLLRLYLRQFNLWQVERQRRRHREGAATVTIGGIIATFGGNSAWNSADDHDRGVMLAPAVPGQDSGAEFHGGNRRRRARGIALRVLAF